MFDEEEYYRWMKASIKTLESTSGDLNRGDYNWHVLKLIDQQNLRLKLCFTDLGLPAYGYSVSKLLMKMPKKFKIQQVLQEAKTLDKYTIFQLDILMLGLKEAQKIITQKMKKAIKCAKKLIEWIESLWKLLKKKETNEGSC
ncbi:MAG: DNA-binding protein [Candidatus Bathyarchaeia archaeon]